MMSACQLKIRTILHGYTNLASAIPPGIPPASVYGFGALTAAEYQQLLSQARIFAAGARAMRGLPAAAAPVPAVGVAGAPGPIGGVIGR